MCCINVAILAGLIVFAGVVLRIIGLATMNPTHTGFPIQRPRKYLILAQQDIKLLSIVGILFSMLKKLVLIVSEANDGFGSVGPSYIDHYGFHRAAILSEHVDNCYPQGRTCWLLQEASLACTIHTQVGD